MATDPNNSAAALNVRNLSVFFGDRMPPSKMSRSTSPPRPSPPSSGRAAAANPLFSAPSTGCTNSTPTRAWKAKSSLFGDDIYSRNVEAGRRPPPRRHGFPEIKSVSDHVHFRERHRRDCG
jgi:hypothetical protein